MPRVAGGSAAASASALCRRPSTRIVRSSGSARGPASSDTRPDAARRISSIWNMRSRACTKPNAAAPSSAVAARMRGMPSASNPIETAADRPGMRPTSCAEGRHRNSAAPTADTASSATTIRTPPHR